MGIKVFALLVLGIAKGGIDLLLGRQKRQERAEYREAGATAQREADKTEALKQKDDQLEKAANARPGDARKRLRDKSF